MSAVFGLTRQDLALVGGTVATAVVAGLVFSPVTDHDALRLLDLATNALISGTILVMLVPLVRASQHWGGEIGRGLQLIALGLFLFVATIVPHIEWHVQGAPYYLGPWVFGLSPAWWVGFYHTLTVVTWGIVIYGFYRFWRIARPGPVSAHE